MSEERSAPEISKIYSSASEEGYRGRRFLFYHLLTFLFVPFLFIFNML